MSISDWTDEAKWICREIGVSYIENRRLIDSLQDRWFEVVFDMDKNRLQDGIALRRRFCDETGCPYSKLFSFDTWERCTVFEMLVALAFRMDDEYGDAKNPEPGLILEEMLENLGVFGVESEAELDYILSTWMERRFRRDGRGSIFPIRDPKRDQRKIQIWDQMQEYIREKIERG